MKIVFHTATSLMIPALLLPLFAYCQTGDIPLGSSNTQMILKAYMMPPRRQVGQRPSACYTLAAVVEYYNNVNSDYKLNLSPDYIYLNIVEKIRQDTLNEVFAFAQQKGTVSASLVPFGASEINSEVNLAKKYKIKDVITLFRATTTEIQKIYDLKKALTRGNPVLVKFNTTEGFLRLNSEDRMWEPSKNESINGQLTLLVVGFDERRKAFEVLHSGGSNWGNRGYIWIRYSDFAQFSTEGYVILPHNE
jgi:hypothetical protein